MRAWLKLLGISFGVAVVAAAAQLGVAQAVGIIRWSDNAIGTATAWNALLTWVVFVFATSVLGGASVGRRAQRRAGRPEPGVVRVAAALAAGIGAAGAVSLAWLPAHGARPPVSVHPELVVAVAAGVGVAIGVVLALLALSIPPVAGGIRASVAWAWGAALFCCVAGIATHRPYLAPRLGVLDAPSLIQQMWWSGPYLMVGVAFLLGLLVATLARWAGAHRAALMVSGLAGPALISGGYLISGPGSAGFSLSSNTAQGQPYVASLVAVVAGFLASALVALPARRLAVDAASESSAGAAFTDPIGPPGTAGHAAGPAGTSASVYAGSVPGPVASAPAARHSTDAPSTGRVTGTARPMPPAPAIGRPPRSADEEYYSGWLKDLGHVPAEN